MSKLRLFMKEVYDQNAHAFDRDIDKSLFEKGWVDLFIDELESNSHVLDVGCGRGEPIAKYLLSKGLKIKGGDYSKEMIS